MVLVGHIDHGKSSILENIKNIVVTRQEAGGITQTIRSYNLKMADIQKACSKILNERRISIPGILVLDTPGHAAFNNMRKRGGNLADIAVLVIDINEGLKPQTLESIEILKTYKTPFIVALNKVDLIYGWEPHPEKHLLESLNEQADSVKTKFDTKFYEIVGKLYEKGFLAERFDKIDDFTKQLTLVPCSAKTGEGLPELLMMVVGMAQRFLEKNLDIDASKPAHGTILEVQDEKGIGTTLDVVIYDGCLKKNDQIVIGGLNEPVITKVRGLFESVKGKYKSVSKVEAAAGVKIVAPNIKDVISGMPLTVANEDLQDAKEKIQKEVGEVLIETDNDGIVIKADSLGSLEALTGLLKAENINIKRASVGAITKKDLADASSEEDPFKKIILAFNVPKVETNEVKIISHDVIYKIIEDYESWIKEEKKKQEAKLLENITSPAKFMILKGCIFRQSNPCVVGVRVLAGKIKTGVGLMKKNGEKCSHIKSMQQEQENIKIAVKNKEVAISIPGICAGRQIKEEEILYTDLNEEAFRKLKDLKKLLSPDEIAILKEIAEIKRKDNPVWGI